MSLRTLAKFSFSLTIHYDVFDTLPTLGRTVSQGSALPATGRLIISYVFVDGESCGRMLDEKVCYAWAISDIDRVWRHRCVADIQTSIRTAAILLEALIHQCRLP